MPDVPFGKLCKATVDALLLFVLTDAKGIIQNISVEYAQMLGQAREEIIGRHITDVIENTGLTRVLKTGKEEIGQMWVFKNGQTTVCNRLPLRDESGKIIGALSMAITHDLKEFSELTEKIKTLQMENEMYRQQLSEIKREAFSMDAFVGESEALKNIKDIIQKIAPSKSSVLLTGETGTGKEVIANVIHQLSSRCFKSFIKINCSAIPGELLESELFGYAEGSFSGAVRGGKPGKFELANSGTILLDEIGELPLTLQPKLLRVLQENVVERVGGTKEIPLDIRVICCTNQSLKELTESGKFRRDLYYRINTVEINIPPLREHKEDIPLLCDYFIKKINKNHGSFIQGISNEMFTHFSRNEWVGNIRELEHVLERACLSAVSGTLEECHFDFFMPMLPKDETREVNPDALDGIIAAAEKTAIQRAIQAANGNKSRAAESLNIARSQLYEKIKKHRLTM